MTWWQEWPERRSAMIERLARHAASYAGQEGECFGPAQAECAGSIVGSGDEMEARRRRSLNAFLAALSEPASATPWNRVVEVIAESGGEGPLLVGLSGALLVAAPGEFHGPLMVGRRDIELGLWSGLDADELAMVRRPHANDAIERGAFLRSLLDGSGRRVALVPPPDLATPMQVEAYVTYRREGLWPEAAANAVRWLHVP